MEPESQIYVVFFYPFHTETEGPFLNLRAAKSMFHAIPDNVHFKIEEWHQFPSGFGRLLEFGRISNHKVVPEHVSWRQEGF